MSSRRRQLLVWIVTAFATVLAFAGCGGSADPVHAVRAAAANTLALRAQSTSIMTGSRLFGASPTIVVRGEFSFPTGLGYAAVQIPARGSRASGTAYLVFLPTKLWVKPLSNASLPAGDLWLSTTLTGVRAPGTAPPSLALVAEALNPQLLLAEIATGAVAASSAGHRVVAHVPYTEYVVSIDLARALAAQRRTGALRIAMAEQLAALRAAGGPSAKAHLRVVARIDGAERLAQMQFSLPGSKLGAVETELWKFGSPVPLSLPLAAETSDIASFRPAGGAVTATRLFTGD
jgi:hypothetical protein